MENNTTSHKHDKVMLLDDNELDNFISEKVIATAGFADKIYVHTNAQSAIEFFTNIGKTGTAGIELYPQVIFIDLNMPMIDGFQFIQYLQGISNIQIAKMKLVILTSSVHDEDEYRATELSPGIVFLRKPLTVEMLTQI